MKSSLIIVGTLSGLVAGVVIGLLTAPCDGSNTRRKITRTTQEAADNLRKVIIGFRSRSGHNVEDVKRLLSEDIEGLTPFTKQQILSIIETSQKNAV